MKMNLRFQLPEVLAEHSVQPIFSFALQSSCVSGSTYSVSLENVTHLLIR